jgi:hypothetical protein
MRVSLKHIAAQIILLIALLVFPSVVSATDFQLIFNVGGPFRIFGHPPIPQLNGFDYFITQEQIDTSLAGATVAIEEIAVSAPGMNLGLFINWDWEVHLDGKTIGLPAGQYLKTLVDPVTGYTRTANTRFQFVIGNRFDTGSYTFSGTHDFTTGITTAFPYLSFVKVAATSPFIVTDGLHAQMFFWTGDNRNVQIEFSGAQLIVRGSILAPAVPEPATLLLFGSGLVALGSAARRRGRRK